MKFGDNYQPKHPEIYAQIESLVKGQGAVSAAEVRELIVSTNPDQAWTENHVAQAMRRMVDQGLIVREGDQIWWSDGKKQASTNDIKPRHSPVYRDDAIALDDVAKDTMDIRHEAQPRKIELSEFARQRQGYMVTVERAPDEYDNVMQIQFLVSGNWFKMPFWGDVRICIGSAIPKWTPQQEINYGVSAFRLVYADGTYFQKDGLNPQDPIVIAPRN